ncbi:MAG: hypothetical protein K9M15_01545 [Candidatus Marinimicrobia bacterium]|nr:hypothetical protein [Candidatus Neomarinimicrobiota bacterium]
MKKIVNLIKVSPVAMIVAGLMVAGVASAALLTVYVTMNGTADVEQSVVFGNGDVEKDYIIGNSPAIAGNTYTENYNLKNKSVTTAPVKFVTNQCKVGGGHCNDESNNEEGVETSYWSTVELSQKDTTTWQVITGGGEGTLNYELVSNTFNYEFDATGLDANTEYSLVYYADKQDRFENWGGDAPGALIAEFTTDSDGVIAFTEGSKNLKMDLPHTDDWNGSADANYCGNNNGFDSYDLCRGAKIWLVHSSDYDAIAKTVSWDNFGDYLYETDLIAYDDANAGGEALWLGEGMLNFWVKNVLNIALEPGDYKVTTKVVPVI